MKITLETLLFKEPLIIAHRGFEKQYPENTLPAFQAATEAGAQMIELDVMLSRDRKPVVIHDATLERTTTGYGPVNDYTTEELKQFDAGSWFHPRFANERLPLLSEVLELVGRRIIVNIEIKTHAHETHYPPDAIEKQVVELVSQKDLLDSVLISSFSVDVLARLDTMSVSPKIALITETPITGRIVDFCSKFGVFSWHPDQMIVTARQVETMHAAGLKVFPYNVETFEDYAKVIDMKVDGVITGDPVSAAQWTRLHHPD
jgi:glycerophosphoryl diester phosphodiesterase